MFFIVQKYILEYLNKILYITSDIVYALIIFIFYQHIYLYILTLKESLLVDYLQKTYLVKLILNWYTAIGIYFDNLGLGYIVDKINKTFNIDLDALQDLWFNYFVHTYFIFFLLNTYLVITIFFF